MGYMFIHQNHISILAKRYLDKQDLTYEQRDSLEQDLLIMEGVLLDPNVTTLHLNAYENGLYWNERVDFIQRLALHIRALARGERSMALHQAIVSDRTSARERARLIRIWNTT